MRRGGTVSGAVSLVMIFCVLCMAVFAALTFATVNRERTLSDLTARRAEEFYRADRVATEAAAALRAGNRELAQELLYSQEPDTPDTDEGTDADGALSDSMMLLDDVFPDGGLNENTSSTEIVYTDTPDGTLADFSLPAGGQQRLEVRLLLHRGDMEVLQWRKVYDGGWETDDTITLAEFD